jgi:hypothetical protein
MRMIKHFKPDIGETADDGSFSQGHRNSSRRALSFSFLQSARGDSVCLFRWNTSRHLHETAKFIVGRG